MTKHKGLPKAIKIGQRVYKVHARTEDADPMLAGSFGYTMTSYDHIVVRKNMSRAQMRSTLLHEVMHAISLVYGNPHAEVEVRDEAEGYDEYSERWAHYFICMYEENLITVMQANPELVRFLLEDEGK